MAHLNHQTREAYAAWGEAFDAIPKSVWAVVAWHLANVASGEADTEGAALARFREELQMLVDGGHLPEAQGKRALKALAA